MSRQLPWSDLSEPERRVFLTILRYGPLARTDLAHRMGLSSGSLTRLTKPLVASGLVREDASAIRRTAGRSTSPLAVKPELAGFLGVNVTRDVAQVVHTDLASRIDTSSVHRLASREPADVADLVARVVEELRAEGPAHRVDAIGISLGGNVPDGRTVDSAVFLDWREVPLAELVEARCGVPAHVDNDVMALTESENWFGVGRRTSRFVQLTIGAGIGAGVVQDERVLRNADVGLGLVGHIPLGGRGARCSYGHEGCSSAMLRTDAIVERLREAGLGIEAAPGPDAFEDVLRRAVASRGGAREIVQDAAVALGRFAAIAAAFTLTTTVVVAGEGAPLAQVLPDAVADGARSLRWNASSLEIVPREHTFTAWARGAATLAIHHVVQSG